MYCARSNASGASVFARLRRPRMSSIRANSIDSIHRRNSLCITAKYDGPCRMIADTICTTSAPARSALIPSFGVATPPVAASEHFNWPRRIASHLSRRSNSALGKFEARPDRQVLKVDIGLQEAVEQHQSSSAGSFEFVRDVCE